MPLSVTEDEHVQAFFTFNMSMCRIKKMSMCRNMKISLCRNTKISICRSMKMSMCRNMKISMCRNMNMIMCRNMKMSMCRNMKMSMCRNMKPLINFMLTMSSDSSDYQEHRNGRSHLWWNTKSNRSFLIFYPKKKKYRSYW